MGSLSSFVNEIISAARTRQTIRNIEMNNEARKCITYYDDSTIEGFVQAAKIPYNYIISGVNKCHQLERGAAAIAAYTLYQGIPVVVIHEGNKDLEYRVKSSTSFSNNRAILTSTSKVYDPFYNRTLSEVLRLAAECDKSDTKMSSVGSQYLRGLLKYWEAKGGKFNVASLIQCPFEDATDRVNLAYYNGEISEAVKISVLNDLKHGQDECYNVEQFFQQIKDQGGDLISNSAMPGHQANIKTAVINNGLICIDIGSRANNLMFNLIMQDLKDALKLVQSKTKVMVIVDKVDVCSNEYLNQFLTSPQSNALLSLVDEDVYSMLGANQNLFTMITTRTERAFLMKAANNLSSEKWADVIGKYDHDEVSKNMGGTKSYYSGGYSDNTSISVNQKKEYIVKPSELLALDDNEAYVRDISIPELAHVKFIN